MLALLYDVHGNLPALEAVLADARAQRADRWLLGGDYSLFGPEPEGTIARLRDLTPAIWLRGNGERWTADPAAAPDNELVPPAIAACREALGATLVAELGDLPEQGIHEDTRYVHASPSPICVRSCPSPPRTRPSCSRTCASRASSSATPTCRSARISTSGGIELVNPGSVGLPYDGDQRAAYALVHPDRRVEHRRVAYGHAASAARMRERWPGAAWADTVARRIEQARPDA